MATEKEGLVGGKALFAVKSGILVEEDGKDIKPQRTSDEGCGAQVTYSQLENSIGYLTAALRIGFRARRCAARLTSGSASKFITGRGYS